MIDIKHPPEQKVIRAKCFHPSGKFIEFPIGDIETSIPARFEEIVRKYPDRTVIIKQQATISHAAGRRSI